MNAHLIPIALSFLLAASLLSAQSSTPAPATNACPPTSTPAELVSALDDAISGPADKDRTCLRALFTPGARLNPLVPTSDGITPRTLLVEDWIAAMQRRGSTPLFEHQIKFTANAYGPMAHLWSTYEIRSSPASQPLARGINSIQAIYDGSHWRIYQVLWIAESPDLPIPADDLP